MKIKATILIIVGLILTVTIIRFIQTPKTNRSLLSTSLAKAKGNPQAAVRITEYTDFQCPMCARGSMVVNEYFKMYPDKMYVQYRHYPLEKMHEHALPIAVAAECAARQNKFWPFQDMVFGRQNLLRETINLDARLSEIAKEVGLNVTIFERCLKDSGVVQVVHAEKAEGEGRKVSATPTYFINDQMFVGVTALQKYLDQAVGKMPWKN